MKRLSIIQDKPSWRSVEEQAGQRDDQIANLESPQGAREWEESDGLSRRGFLGVAGTTLAASSALLSGCIRKPAEHIVPLSSRPEDNIPGAALHYNTVARVGGSVQGLRITSMDGRPTKVDGNPKHPGSLGGAGPLAQATIMELYDPDRSRSVRHAGVQTTWAEADAALQGRGGQGMAILVEDEHSPTVARLLAALAAQSPDARVFVHDPTRPNGEIAGAALVGLQGWRPALELTDAKVIVALDHDFLGIEGDVARVTRGFAQGRKIRGNEADISRLYVVEPGFTNTGANADNRLRLKASAVPGFLAALATKLFSGEFGLRPPEGAAEAVAALSGDDSGHGRWVDALTADLLAHRGASVLLVGERQPAACHALVHLLNAALGNVGKTTRWFPSPSLTDRLPGLDELAAAIKAQSVRTLVMLGGNPALTAAAGLGFAELLASVEVTVHLSRQLDETSSKSTWHLPASHFLEAWGDERAFDGTYAIQQPLIAPLFETRSSIELLGLLATGKVPKGHDEVALTAGALPLEGVSFEMAWRRWLHDGVAGFAFTAAIPAVGASVLAPLGEAAPLPPAGTDGVPVDAAGLAVAPTVVGPTWNFTRLTAALSSLPKTVAGLELVLGLDSRLLDGRFANLAWLQELPDPVSKLTWDNAAIVSVRTASTLGIVRGQMVRVEHDGRGLEIATFIVPGVADDVVLLAVGSGRPATFSRFATGGVNAWPLKGDSWYGAATLSAVPGADVYLLASTQEHGRMDPAVKTPFGTVQYARRALAQEATVAVFAADATFAQHEPLAPLKSLWIEPNVRTGQQWGMTIDLQSCTGCNACTIACQAENNIQVVGKERVANGREMHWIRLDRYFTGDVDTPEAIFQPVACAHCETAPCESVCPVAATSHSPDGLNDMAYNRCIGTRYCANNCPYKVRRFNFFNFSKENHAENDLLAMQQNPNVTVRFRGVIEKCTYCVQRISSAKIVAKVQNADGVVPDGAIIPACAETCPAEAIVFGDISDPESRVSKLKAQPRNYAMLQDLNIHPRTTYLSKVRNPNPELA